MCPTQPNQIGSHIPPPAPFSLSQSPSLPRRGRKALCAQQHALDGTYALLDAPDLVVRLIAAGGGGAVDVGGAGAKGFRGVGEGVEVGAECVEDALGVGEGLGVVDDVGVEAAEGGGEEGEAVGLLLGLLLGGRGGGISGGGGGRLVVVGGGGEEGWLGGGGGAGRGLHAHVAMEELARVVVGAVVVVAVVLVCGLLLVVDFITIVVLPARGVVRRGDLGDGALEGGDEAGEVGVGGVVQVDAGVGQGGDHGGDDVLSGAVDEGGGAADEGEGVEEARGGDEGRGLGGLGEELGVGHYRRMGRLCVGGDSGFGRGWRGGGGEGGGRGC